MKATNTIPLHGKYYEAVRKGNVYIASTAVAGVKPPASNATAQVFGLFNPLGSEVNAIPLFLNAGFVDTTGAAGNLQLSYLKPAGAGVATGSPITAFTASAAINAKVGAGNNSRVFATLSAATVTAPAVLMTLGASQLVTTAATTTSIWWNIHYDFDGSLIIPPGVAVFVTGNTALLSNLSLTMIWEEIDEDTVE